MSAEARDATVFALSSAAGRGGVAVIRVSGGAAGGALRQLAGSTGEPRRARLAVLRHPLSGEALDRALTLWFPGPESFTGEDVAELHVHGGPAVIAAVSDALSAVAGLRPAEPGEFARRAFGNGKLDLTEVEGLADLIGAETEAQRRQAVAQMGGALGARYEGWRRQLVAALARIEALIDFPEDEVPETVVKAVRSDVEALAAAIGGHLNDGHRGERLRNGYSVVIAGPPNAGKSSLLNALARRDAAIVSSEAGTTRDVVEVSLDLGGFPVDVADTAGIREAGGEVEREGVRRARARARAADLVLWLRDCGDAAAAGPPPDLGGSVLVVPSKADLVESPPRGAISAQTGAGVADLLGRLQEMAAGALASGGEPAITRHRHRLSLSAAAAALQGALDQADSSPELLAENLRWAAMELGRLTGRVDVEDLLDVIFAEFCIGK